MKAIVYARYGPPDVLQLKEIEKPTPKDDEVLVRVHAASLNAYDWHTLRGKPFLVRLMGFGLLKPKKQILGSDFAGRVEAVGRSVKQFQPGEEVYGMGGGFAEYVCKREDRLALKPANASFEEAAAVPMAAITALQGLRDKGQIRAGQKVLIEGASGGVGTFAVQIAKSFGTEVTAVCSTRNLDQARSIGADHVIDYTQEDFTKSGERYDLIHVANGNHSIFSYRRALNPNGVCVMTGGGSMSEMFLSMLLAPLISMTGSKKMTNMTAQVRQRDLIFMKGLLEAGKVVPVIERRYPLSQAAEALRYLGEGHAQGKLVIALEQDDKPN
ncbi:MAG: NAD(P)-dependent alcohol dehydrogenase [Nitrososphaerales archaeon]|jgi:NADPH:quinone reductase-like Zn-dependent oxidoreductase